MRYWNWFGWENNPSYFYSGVEVCGAPYVEIAEMGAIWAMQPCYKLPVTRRLSQHSSTPWFSCFVGLGVAG